MEIGFSADEQARRLAADVAIQKYVDRPCTICGRVVTKGDADNGAVYTGQTEDYGGSAAHKRCWEGFEAVLRNLARRGELGRALNWAIRGETR